MAGENGEFPGDDVYEAKDWLSKAEAAVFAGLGTRQIERHQMAGRVRKQTLPRLPNETTARVVYSRSDLAALKAGTPNDYGHPEPPEPVAALPNTAALAPVSEFAANGPWFQLLSALLGRLPGAPAPKPRLWLTLAEAAEYSGLPELWLLNHARQGYVDALDLGGRPRGGRWRFRRDGLAELGR